MFARQHGGRDARPGRLAQPESASFTEVTDRLEPPGGRRCSKKLHSGALVRTTVRVAGAGLSQWIEAVCPGQGDWLSGRALRSHRRGRWFEPSIAHESRRARKVLAHLTGSD